MVLALLSQSPGHLDATPICTDTSRASCITETKLCAQHLLPSVQERLGRPGSPGVEAESTSLSSAVAAAEAAARERFANFRLFSVQQICSSAEGGLGKKARPRGIAATVPSEH